MQHSEPPCPTPLECGDDDRSDGAVSDPGVPAKTETLPGERVTDTQFIDLAGYERVMSEGVTV